MPAYRLLALLFTLTLLVGCHPRPQPTAQQLAPASANALANLRQLYQRLHPNAQLGLVTATYGQYVKVEDVDGRNFRINQVVVFVDANNNTLTTGTVRRVFPDALHVRFDLPKSGHRAPRIGDVMVRFPPGNLGG